ncbi:MULTISPECIES: LysR family transcriptional regulator [Cysteiniphilum]|uniref:LysR family transcriptional regulator n=1 Tax=Cysteiniphilum TaxID=2056696 RepID=UPI00178417D3|nr:MULTISPECIES: LysR family transcriptional regulator [Cysteiniphilum]
MDISDLQLLYILLTERNITYAAEKMSLSQPAATIRLGKMRKRFNDELLVRQGNTMVLTEKATTIIQPLKRLLEQINGLFPHPHFDPRAEPCIINIHMNEYCEYLVSKTLFDAIHSFHPQHEIHLHIFPPLHNLEGIHDFSNAEIIIGAINENDLDEFESETSHYDPVCLLYDRYPIDQTKALTLDEYFNLPHILINALEEGNPFLKTLGSPDPRNIKMRILSLNLATTLLEDKFVMTSVKSLAENYNLNTHPLPIDIPPVACNIHYPQRLKFDAKNKWLRDICKNEIQKLAQSLNLKIPS